MHAAGFERALKKFVQGEVSRLSFLYSFRDVINNISRILPEGVTHQIMEVTQGRSFPLRFVLCGDESAVNLGIFHLNAAISQLESRIMHLRAIDSKSQRDKASLTSFRSEFQLKCASHFELPMSFEFKRIAVSEIPQTFLGHLQDAIGVECILVALPTDRASAEYVMRKLHFIAGQHGLLSS